MTLSLLAWTVLPLLGLGEPSRPEVLAVFPIHDKSRKQKASDVDQLSELLASEIVRRSHYKVIPRGEIEALLRTEKNKSFESCYDESCQIQLGRELAANKVLKTQLLALGGRCVLTSTLYDLKTASADWAHTEKSGCSSAEFLVAVEAIAAALGSRAPAAEPAALGQDPSTAPQPPSEEVEAIAPTVSGRGGSVAALSLRGGMALSPLVFFGEVSGSLSDLSWFRINLGAGLKLFDRVSLELQLAPLLPIASPEFDFLVVPGLRFDLGYVYAHGGAVIAVVDGTAGVELSAGARLMDTVYVGPVVDVFFEGVVYLGLEAGVEFEVAL